MGPAAATLLADGDTVGLTEDHGHLVDAHRIGQLANAPMVTVDAELGDLIRGRFLEGFSVGASPEFDDWVSRWSSWCSSRTSDLLERSARWAIASGRLAGAEEAAARWAEFAPYEDAPVALMVEIQALRGSRSAALATYDRHVELLETELGAEPGEQMVDLVERVRRGEFGYPEPGEALQGLLAKAEEEVAGSRPDVAVVYFDQAFELLETVGVAEAVDATAQVLVGRGRALELSHRFEEARADYETLASRATDTHNLAWKLTSLIGLARLHATPNELMDPRTAQAYAQQALDLARLLGDRQGEAEALWAMLVVDHYSLGDEEAALEHGLEALRIARTVDGSSTLPFILNDLHWVYATRGDLGAAAECLDEAIDEWDRAGNEAMLIDSLNGAGLLRTIMGDFNGAREAAERGAAVALRTHNVWNQLAVNANLGMLHREVGAYDQGMSALRASIDAAAREMPVARRYYQGTLAILLGDLGAHDEVLDICDEIGAHSEATPPFWRMAETARTLRIRALVAAGTVTADHLDELAAIGGDTVGLAHVSIVAPLVEMEGALASGDFERALERGDRFLAAARRAAARLGVTEALLLAGRAQLALGSTREAIATLPLQLGRLRSPAATTCGPASPAGDTATPSTQPQKTRSASIERRSHLTAPRP
jgi:tetratricopeptide (TPR) repeat protein